MISRSGRRSVIPLTWWTFVTDVTCQAVRRVSSRTGPARRTTTLAARRLVPRRGAYTARSDPQREAQIHPVGPRRAAPLRATTDLDRGAPARRREARGVDDGRTLRRVPELPQPGTVPRRPAQRALRPAHGGLIKPAPHRDHPVGRGTPSRTQAGNSANWCRRPHSKVAAVTHS